MANVFSDANKETAFLTGFGGNTIGIDGIVYRLVEGEAKKGADVIGLKSSSGAFGPISWCPGIGIMGVQSDAP